MLPDLHKPKAPSFLKNVSPVPSMDPAALARLTDDLAERASLDGLLRSPKLLAEFRPQLRPAVCYSEAHAEVLRAILDLHDRGATVDELTVCTELRRRDVLDTIGGRQFVEGLRGTVQEPEHARPHLELCIALSAARDFCFESRRIVAEGLSSKEHPYAFIERNMRALTRIVTRADDRVPVHTAAQVVRTCEAKWTKERENQDHQICLPTGFWRYDRVTDGLPLKAITMWAALSGSGKSLVAHQVAHHIAQTNWNGIIPGVVFVSGEMDAEALYERALCSEARVDLRTFRRVRRGAKTRPGEDELTPQQRYNVDLACIKAAHDIESRPIAYFTKVTDLMGIRAALRKAQTLMPNNPIKLLVVDYVQMMKLPKAERNDLALGEFAYGLRELADQEDLHTMVLSQLVKTSMMRGRPRKEDLKGATALADAAYTVTMVHRPLKVLDNPSMEQRKELEPYCELVIDKGRGHQTGLIPMGWEGEHYRIRDERRLGDNVYEFDDLRNRYRTVLTGAA